MVKTVRDIPRRRAKTNQEQKTLCIGKKIKIDTRVVLGQVAVGTDEKFLSSGVAGFFRKYPNVFHTVYI